jgi:hypothetical protein
VPANAAEGGLDPPVADGAPAPELVDQPVVEPLGFVFFSTGQVDLTSRLIGTGSLTI